MSLLYLLTSNFSNKVLILILYTYNKINKDFLLISLLKNIA